MATAASTSQAPVFDGRTKPPFLRRVRIERYKSIAYCDVSLQPLTILVGRNSSGKSNFLNALAFLRDALARGTDEAVRLHGGPRAVLPRSSRATTISFRITADYESDFLSADELDRFTADYDVRIKLSDRSKPAVRSRARPDRVGQQWQGPRI